METWPLSRKFLVFTCWCEVGKLWNIALVSIINLNNFLEAKRRERTKNLRFIIKSNTWL